MSKVPARRIRTLVDLPPRSDGEYVLYWMTAARRLTFNHALQRAVEAALAAKKPLVILEALRVGYPHASDRLHRFVLQGMEEHAAALAEGPVLYLPYVEDAPGKGQGLLAALAARAVAVIGDDWPCFFHPRMVQAASERLRTRYEVVDASGIMPYAAAKKAFARAVDYRRYVQKNLASALAEAPLHEPLRALKGQKQAVLAPEILRRWPRAGADLLAASPKALAGLPIDHRVAPVDDRGGTAAAKAALDRFVATRIHEYAEERNHPDADKASGLSPWLHFGHIGAFEIFEAVTKAEGWSPLDVSPTTRGQREGFFGLSKNAEAFLDQLLVWRELGLNGCAYIEGYDRYESLPAWAKKTLDEHREDERDPVYELAEFEAAATHDPLWNAAQRELVQTGRMHNYMRMLWGKKILHWSATPEEAMETMIVLNDRYALDGRDPNSYCGISWVLGRYDRAWGPERPIFGKIRYMASENTARKLDLKQWLARFGAAPAKRASSKAR